MENLRQLRKKAGLSQQRLADALGHNFSQTQIHSYETGAYEPDIKNMIRIAEYFNISIDHLVGRTIIVSINENEHTDNDRQYFEMYRNIPESKRRSLFLFMETLKDE